MPPKVSSVEVMATQLAAPVECPVEETQQATQPVQGDQLTPNEVLSQPENTTAEPALLETPPKRRRSKANGSTAAKKLHAATASVLAMQISNDLEIHPFIVHMILDSLEKSRCGAFVGKRHIPDELVHGQASHAQGSPSWRAAARLRQRHRCQG